MVKQFDRLKAGDGTAAPRVLTGAMHDPHFARQFWCWAAMQRDGFKLPAFEWSLDAAYCLDRTEAVML